MDFEFTDDQLGFQDAARSLLASACPPALVRAVHEGTGDGADLWRQLGELDWTGIAIAEETANDSSTDDTISGHRFGKGDAGVAAVKIEEAVRGDEENLVAREAEPL